jgi:hypothetical protein
VTPLRASFGRSEIHRSQAALADKRGNEDGSLARSEWVAFKTGEAPLKTEL